MSTKSDALLRDIAALFVKYRAAEWQPLLGGLSDPATLARLADVIREGVAVAQTTSKRKPPQKAARRKPRAPAKSRLQVELEPPAPRFSGPNADAIEQLRSELLGRKLLAKMVGLRALWVALGIKAEVPKRRESAIATIAQHLDGLDAPNFASALDMLKREQQRDNPDDQPHFQRWFDLITDRPRS